MRRFFLGVGFVYGIFALIALFKGGFNLPAFFILIICVSAVVFAVKPGFVKLMKRKKKILL
jgi:hypothetical protein